MKVAVTAIGFPDLVRRLAALDLPPVDLVVGIGRGADRHGSHPHADGRRPRRLRAVPGGELHRLALAG